MHERHANERTQNRAGHDCSGVTGYSTLSRVSNLYILYSTLRYELWKLESSTVALRLTLPGWSEPTVREAHRDKEILGELRDSGGHSQSSLYLYGTKSPVQSECRGTQKIENSSELHSDLSPKKPHA
jgi:hypothetical protein